jgi:hypothetical protein
MTRLRRLARCQREPSQPRRKQDTKKNTKGSLCEQLRALVSSWFTGGWAVNPKSEIPDPKSEIDAVEAFFSEGGCRHSTTLSS